MTANYALQGTTRSGLPHRQRPEPGIRTAYQDELRQADHACCCSARPAVVAVMPPSAGRDHPTGILLCGHHYRASRAAPAAAGASVLDRDGMPVMPRAEPLPGAR
jgi:hypothetical protein